MSLNAASGENPPAIAFTMSSAVSGIKGSLALVSSIHTSPWSESTRVLTPVMRSSCWRVSPLGPMTPPTRSKGIRTYRILDQRLLVQFLARVVLDDASRRRQEFRLVGVH